jgi:hypothetical protein
MEIAGIHPSCPVTPEHSDDNRSFELRWKADPDKSRNIARLQSAGPQAIQVNRVRTPVCP